MICILRNWSALGKSFRTNHSVFPNLSNFYSPDLRHLWAFLTFFNSNRDEILLYLFLLSIIFVIAAQSQCFMDQHSTNWNDGWLSCKTSPFTQPKSEAIAIDSLQPGVLNMHLAKVIFGITMKWMAFNNGVKP